MKSNYIPLNKFFIRTPKESLSIIQEIQKGETILCKIFQQIFFLEALYVASPELYNETIKWINGHNLSEKEEQKLKYSLYKYLTRMSSRCTPFGLFAGFNMGEVGEYTNIEVLSPTEEKTRYRVNRLDMNYSCALGQYFSKQESIRKNLKFFPNNSIYTAGDKLRYVEYLYGDKSRRLHQVTAVDRNEYLIKILNHAKYGSTIENLIHHIVENDITFTEAENFILELIDNQILVSELEPQITEPDYWSVLISKLSEIKGCEIIVNDLNKVKSMLEQLDYLPIGVEVEKHYGEIKRILGKLDINFEEKFLFQADMLIPFKCKTINKDIPLKIIEGIELLNKLSTTPAETNLSKFISEFNKRYEGLEVELTMVLDPETGIGYPIGSSSDNDLSPLLDGLIPPRFQPTQNQMEWNPVHFFLQKKYIDALKNNAFSTELTPEEINDLPLDNNPLPNTISAMVELIPPDKENEEERIIMGPAGGTSALCLIGRFCHADEEFHRYALDIAQKEKDLSGDKIIAEIVHLPEARTGNVLMHPVFFDYEIPYLANPNVDQNHTIEISDLMISIRQNKVFLRSKKFNKQVVPRLSNAHNFSNSTISTYRFLCDLQMQGLRSGVGFHWGHFANDYQFLPRVTYKNLILFEATWNLKKKDIEPLLKAKNNIELKTIVELWRSELRIPNLVTLTDGDNELLIDFANIFSIKVLLDTIKKRASFKLKEYLHHIDLSPVKDVEGKAYANQLVFAFYRNPHQEEPVKKNLSKNTDLS